MKLSELIRELEYIRKHSGDIEVKYENTAGLFPYSGMMVKFDNEPYLEMYHNK